MEHNQDLEEKPSLIGGIISFCFLALFIGVFGLIIVDLYERYDRQALIMMINRVPILLYRGLFYIAVGVIGLVAIVACFALLAFCIIGVMTILMKIQTKFSNPKEEKKKLNLNENV